jgi:hypothetical protein
VLFCRETFLIETSCIEACHASKVLNAKTGYIYVYFSYNLCGQLKIEELPPGCLQVGRCFLVRNDN